MRRVPIVAAVVVAIVGLLAPTAALAGKPAPSCSVGVSGDGTREVTFTATTGGVKPSMAVSFRVDGVEIASPFTTRQPGTHQAVLQVRDRKGTVLCDARAVATVPEPIAVGCDASVTALGPNEFEVTYLASGPADFTYAFQDLAGFSQQGTLGGPVSVTQTWLLGAGEFNRATVTVLSGAGDPVCVDQAEATGEPPQEEQTPQ